MMSLFLSSCSRSFYIDYKNINPNELSVFKPRNADINLTITPSRNTINTSISLNQKLILDRRNIKTVSVYNMPNGNYDIHCVGGDWSYKTPLNETMNITIDENEHKTLFLPIPPLSNGYWIYLGLIGLGIFIF